MAKRAQKNTAKESASSQPPALVANIGELRPDPQNARRHNPRNIGMIARSLSEVGAARSIVIDEENNILAGNGTIEAAADAGIHKVHIVDTDGETIVAVRRRGLTAAQKRMLALYDNRTAELADWNEVVLADLADRMLLGSIFTSDELRDLLERLGAATDGEVDAEPQVDRADELRKKWGVERGQIWKLGEHRLMCGDSTSAEDVSRLLDGEKPRLMVTDPPYGVEYDPNWRNEADRANGKAIGARALGRVQNDDRADWSAAWALFPGDVAYVWHSGIHSAEVQTSLERCGFVLRTQIIWAKSNMVISRGHYHGKHEPCFYSVRKGATGLWAGDRTQTSLWEIDKPSKNETGHGTQKPVECMSRAIRNHDSKLVYEPFSGSGTAIIACEQLRRRCYAMEVDAGYVAVAVQRWVDATAGRAELVSGGS